MLRILLLVSVLCAPCVAAEPALVEAMAPGDEVRVSVPGVVLEGEVRVVDEAGRLNFGHLGAVVVAGMAERDAEAALRAHFARTLRDASGVTLTLVSHGVIVDVTGFVDKPGPKVLRRAHADIWSAITAAAPSSDADLSRVVLRRGAHDVVVDVRSWLTGDGTALAGLLSGDSLFVPARAGLGGVREAGDNEVLIVGSVVHPGYVARTRPLELWRLLGQAGGPTPDADLTAVRVVSKHDSRSFDVAGALATGAAIELPAGPLSIFVPRRDADTRLSSTVNVIGGVQRPGAYPLGAALPLYDVLTLAGGPNADADLRRVTIVHRRGGLTTSSVVDVATHPGRAADSIVVHPGDTVLVAQLNEDPLRVAIKVLGDIALVAGVIGVVFGLIGGAQ